MMMMMMTRIDDEDDTWKYERQEEGQKMTSTFKVVGFVQANI